MQQNLTTGSVFRNVVRFSLPYLLAYFLQTLYGMADLFIVGQYEGVAATTAVSIGSQVMHMLTVMLVGLAMGTTVSIARAVGAGDRAAVSRATGNTVTLFTVVSLVLTAVLLLLVRPITAVMSTPAEAVNGTAAYLTICFCGIPFITAYNILSSIFRGMGDSKSPMYFVAVACAANIALDYLFMGALRMGPAGAALGTTLSQAVSVAISLWVILHRKDSGISVRKTDFRTEQACHFAYFLHRSAGGFPGRPHSGFVHHHHDHCEPAWSDGRGCGRYRRENYFVPVPHPIVHALHRVGARCTEHRRREKGTRGADAALRHRHRHQ